MAKYKQLSYGSVGTDVEEMQKALNATNNGYNLATDGIYGEKTKAAVLDYQTKNSLAKDGIAGDETLGHLYRTTAPAATTPSTPTPAVTTPTTTAPVVKTALQTHQEQKPEDFTWEHQEDLTKAWQAFLDREKFSYDLTSDPVYQQYRDQYTHLGQLAMMDTMGQAAALTGGYGNSYAQTAGQQTYQGYLQQLNNVVPELYGQAYNRYRAEGEALYNEALAYETMRQQAYAEYQDKNSRWYQDRDYLAALQAQDREQLQLLLSMGYEPSDEELTQAGMTRAQATTLADYYESLRNPTADTTSTGSYSTGSTTGYGYRNYDNMGYGEELVRKAQEIVGATQDGKWGSESQAKAEDMGYENLEDVINRKKLVIPSFITERLNEGFTNDEEKMAYLVEQTQNHQITSTQMGQLAAEYSFGSALSGNGGNGTGFTGSTYQEAAAYLKANGKSSGGLYTQMEWINHKNNDKSGKADENWGGSYQEYLAAFIYDAISD